MVVAKSLNSAITSTNQYDHANSVFDEQLSRIEMIARCLGMLTILFTNLVKKKKNRCAIKSTKWPPIIRKVVVYKQRKKESYNEEA